MQRAAKGADRVHVVFPQRYAARTFALHLEQGGAKDIDHIEVSQTCHKQTCHKHVFYSPQTYRLPLPPCQGPPSRRRRASKDRYKDPTGLVEPCRHCSPRFGRTWTSRSEGGWRRGGRAESGEPKQAAAMQLDYATPSLMPAHPLQLRDIQSSNPPTSLAIKHGKVKPNWACPA